MQFAFRFGLAFILLLRALAAHAQTEYKPMYFDFTPLVGYRTIMTFTSEPEAEGMKAPRLVLESSPSYGAAFGLRLSDEDLFEFRWARQNTHIRVEDAILPFREAVILDQFHGDFTHEYILDDWPPYVRPYIMASVGATHIHGGSNKGFTRFSFGLGAGIKAFVNRHLGFRVQGEWLPVVVDPQVTFVCGGGCIVHFSGQIRSQGEFAVGPLIRF